MGLLRKGRGGGKNLKDKGENKKKQFNKNGKTHQNTPS